MSAQAPPPPPPRFIWDVANSTAMIDLGTSTLWYTFNDVELAKRVFCVRPDDMTAGQAVARGHNDSHMLAFSGDMSMKAQCCTQSVLIGANHLDFKEWYTSLAATNRFLALMADRVGFTAYLQRLSGGDAQRNSVFWEHEKADAVDAFFGAVAADCGGNMIKFDGLMRAFGIFYPRDAAEQSLLAADMTLANQVGLAEEQRRRALGYPVRR
ncbi:hypothetical protein CLAFUW4_04197 [Fulvia fulva]|nr:hypothetical protein CLAFUR4_04183 [Fulvia fulva]WPV14391.1 hypothetical protein CLAFUW4_04197 [Fulvia fulva]WPV28387.1 hypothetical protein CLAFUW7_04186 [Fulvia fulva]